MFAIWLMDSPWNCVPAACIRKETELETLRERFVLVLNTYLRIRRLAGSGGVQSCIHSAVLCSLVTAC